MIVVLILKIVAVIGIVVACIAVLSACYRSLLVKSRHPKDIERVKRWTH